MCRLRARSPASATTPEHRWVSASRPATLLAVTRKYARTRAWATLRRRADRSSTLVGVGE
eukprot:3474592-Alexandrium_andersonii.AAC.1